MEQQVRALVESLRAYRATRSGTSLANALDATNALLTVHAASLNARETNTLHAVSDMIAARIQANDAKALATAGGGTQPYGPPHAPPQQQHEEAIDFSRNILTPAQIGDASLANIVGYGAVKDTIVKRILLPIRYPDVFQRQARGVMMYGPGGTGKSLFARAIAADSGKPTFFVTGSDVMGKYVGESEKRMRALMDAVVGAAKREGAAVLFFDEADSVLGASDEHAQKAVNEFKARYDDIKSEDVTIIVATNAPGVFTDPGVSRRLGLPLYVGIPTKDDAVALINYYAAKASASCWRPVAGVAASPFFTQQEIETQIYPRMQTMTGDNIRQLMGAAESMSEPGRYDLANVESLRFCRVADATAPLGHVVTPLMLDNAENAAYVARSGDACVPFERLSHAERGNICWPKINAAAVMRALNAGIVTASTQWRNLEDYADYARSKPDDAGLRRICEDMGKFVALDAFSVANVPGAINHNYALPDYCGGKKS